MSWLNYLGKVNVFFPVVMEATAQVPEGTLYSQWVPLWRWWQPSFLNILVLFCKKNITHSSGSLYTFGLKLGSNTDPIRTWRLELQCLRYKRECLKWNTGKLWGWEEDECKPDCWSRCWKWWDSTVLEPLSLQFPLGLQEAFGSFHSSGHFPFPVTWVISRFK